MDEKILALLRSHSDSFISGEQLSRKLSVSKATLSRHLDQLRAEGYDIQAQPHLGYRLVAPPDRLLAGELSWQLQTKIIGRKIFAYDTVDSTNQIAFSLAEQGALEGTAVFAEAQKKGKGRLGRRWISPKRGGIYLSLVLRPKIPGREAVLITLLAALSCAETIRRFCGLAALIRWPNDILVNHKKVCGILTEMQTEATKVKFIVLGIGMNVNTPLDKLPSAASSLKEEVRGEEREFSRVELARELLCQLDQHYLGFQEQGSSEIIRQWRNLSAFCGKRVKAFFTDRTIEGLAQGIDEQGALIVRLDNGFKQHILAGEVVKVR